MLPVAKKMGEAAAKTGSGELTVRQIQSIHINS